jgi:DNA-binding SARP family transcriptional activator
VTGNDDESRVERRVGEVRLQLLGGFLLFADGGVVEVPLSSQRLAAFVALHDEPVMRQRVAGSLWLDKPEERAAANLRSALWRLNACGASVVVSRGSHLVLDPSVQVDLRRLDRWMAGTASTDDPVDATTTAHQELLPDWYDDWVVLERERVRQRGLHALEALCVALAEAGQFARSIDVGLAAVAVDPLRESAQRAVIGAHLAEGNPREALRQFESYRRLLKDELGLEPSNTMLALLSQSALQPA